MTKMFYEDPYTINLFDNVNNLTEKNVTKFSIAPKQMYWHS